MAVLRWWSRWVCRGRVGRAEYSGSDGGWVLTYTLRYRLSVALVFAGFTALYVTAFVGPYVPLSNVTGYLKLVGSIGVWLFFTAIFVSSLVERVTVTEEGLRRRTWRGRQQIAWRSVTTYNVNRDSGTIRLDTAEGQHLLVSLYLDGLWAVADALDQRVNPGLGTVVAQFLPPRAML